LAAQRALKDDEELYFSDEELNRLLPPKLRIRAVADDRSLLAPVHGHEDLNRAVSALWADLNKASRPRNRLQALLEKWEFLLPMASAILTVLYPTEFTVYDVRVCETLGEFGHLKNQTQFDRVWGARTTGLYDRRDDEISLDEGMKWRGS